MLGEEQVGFFLQILKRHLEETAYQEEDHRGKLEKYGFLATPYYRYLHTLKVLDYALTICKEEGGRRDVVILSSIFHDLERFTTPPLLHGQKGAVISQRILDQHGVPEETRDKVYEAIYHHVGQDRLEDLSLEGAILVEADRLDKLGNKGIMVHFLVTGCQRQNFQQTIHSFREYLLERGRRDRGIFRTATGSSLLEEKIMELESFLKVLEREVVVEEEPFYQRLYEKIETTPL